MAIWATGLAWSTALVVVLWGASLVRRDASLIDPFWGIGFAMLAWVYAALAGVDAPRVWVAAGLTTLWGVRLFLHLIWRKRGEGEDYRYAAMRERWGSSFPWVSLGTVFLLQGLLMWLISLPLARIAVGGAAPWHPFDVVGGVLFLVGFLFEAVGDWQLARFKRDVSNRGQVLDRGLWRYTRHPNYFGDAVLWWGLTFFALAIRGNWYVLVAPIVMTVLLLRVSGVTLLERRLVDVKPGYRDYVRRTNAFLPWFPRP